jgi:hypothetical protein
MMNNLYKTFRILSILGLSILLFSCNNDEVAPSLYDLPVGGAKTPVINSINPPNSALAGVTIVTITGENFNPSVNNNFVFFNGQLASILSASSTELEVIPPVVISDSVIVKVSSYKSEDFSNTIIYKLEPAVSEYYPFDAEQKKEFPYGIWATSQENVYVSLSALGINEIVAGTPTSLVAFAPKGPETFFRAITLASDNAIYAVRGGVKGVYKVVANTSPAAFVSSANGISDNVNDVEYDATRDVIWGGGSTGILYRIKLDKNVKKYNVDGTVNAVRVAGNDLFIATTTNDEEIIWKSAIINADSLGTPEQYINFTSNVDSAKIMDIVISADGDLYVGTDKSSDPVFTVHPDKSFEVLYPGLIDGQVYSLSWGYGDVLYMTNIVDEVNKTVLRINMQKQGTH